MAIVSMADAVSGEIASSAEYNKVVDNVYDLDTRTTTLESVDSPGAYYGQWTDINNSTGGQTIDTSAGEKVLEFTEVSQTPVGCSMSSGTVTLDVAGWWEVVVSTQYTAGTSVRAVWFSKSSNTSGSGLPKYGALAGPSMDAQSTSALIKVTAGEVISVYAAIWQSGDPLDIWREGGNNLTVVWLGE